MKRERYDRLVELQGIITESMDEISNILRDGCMLIYQNWKAYGKQVTNEFVSSGESLPDIIDKLEFEIEDEEDEI